jgi:plasmid stabilization system protein ParE
MRIELDPRAEAEARAAFLWYFWRSPAAANGFRHDLENTLRQVADAPRRWPEVSTSLRRCLFQRFPYAVIYWIATDEMVRVVAVAHQHRRPGYWTAR